MNVLLLGHQGQLGKELSRSLLLLGNLTALGRSDLDLSNLDALSKILKQLKPDLIVNAAAYTAVDKAEQDTDNAYQINEHAVAVLADYAKQHNALLIHYSTDYVFDGTKQGAYLETDLTNPLNVYGASKLAGEQTILESGCRAYIFRTSWVFSVSGQNFIKTILNLAQQKNTLSIVADQRGAPTSVELISDTTLLAIQAIKKERLAPGLYHLTASGVTTWYDLACYVIEKALTHQVRFQLDQKTIQPILSDAYLLPATRPKNSMLDTTTLSTALDITLPDWAIYVDRVIPQLIRMRFLA